jgi:phosphoglycolate phosphatase
MTMPTEVESPIEVLNPALPRGGYKVALFDFDGTLSLVRRNWQAVMIPMFVDVLAATGTAESREELGVIVEDFVMKLNGKQTIYQAMRLAEEVTKRGGTPLEPLAYKHRYLELLWVQIEERVVGLKNGSIPTDDLTVPGSRELLQTLTDRGITPILASGTDLQFVKDEVAALQLEHFFGDRIYGALDDYKKFSKAMVIEKIVADLKAAGVEPRALVAFGDGYVEIEETKKAGGTAIGVASEEETRQGVNLWKRNRLVGVGADCIVGDYRRLEELLALLGI